MEFISCLVMVINDSFRRRTFTIKFLCSVTSYMFSLRMFSHVCFLDFLARQTTFYNTIESRQGNVKAIKTKTTTVMLFTHVRMRQRRGLEAVVDSEAARCLLWLLRSIVVSACVRTTPLAASSSKQWMYLRGLAIVSIIYCKLYP